MRVSKETPDREKMEGRGVQVFASFFNDQIRPQEETRQSAYLCL